MAQLLIIRGLPGSGKTTYAHNLQCDPDGWIDTELFEADMYFERPDGIYDFNPKLIPNAHQWCYRKVVESLKSNTSTIVANTFTRKWEYQKYIDYCKEHDIPYEVITCTGNYQNVHGVPQETIEKMRQRWED